MTTKEVDGRADARHGTFDYGPTRPDGQHEHYPVLKAEERAKGFVRPLYRAYKHVGRAICGNTNVDVELALEVGKVWACSEVPDHEGDHGETCMQVTPEEARRRVRGGCGTVTTMGLALCETYCRDPGFYSATFCAGCRAHFPVGEQGEFVWVDGSSDTTLKVGT